jgi:hypothetical protein
MMPHTKAGVTRFRQSGFSTLKVRAEKSNLKVKLERQTSIGFAKVLHFPVDHKKVQSTFLSPKCSLALPPPSAQ